MGPILLRNFFALIGIVQAANIGIAHIILLQVCISHLMVFIRLFLHAFLDPNFIKTKTTTLRE